MQALISRTTAIQVACNQTTSYPLVHTRNHTMPWIFPSKLSRSSQRIFGIQETLPHIQHASVLAECHLWRNWNVWHQVYRFPNLNQNFYDIVPQIFTPLIQWSVFSKKIQTQTLLSLVQLSFFWQVHQLHALLVTFKKISKSAPPKKITVNSQFSLNALPWWYFRLVQNPAGHPLTWLWACMPPLHPFGLAAPEVAEPADWTPNLNGPESVLVDSHAC